MVFALDAVTWISGMRACSRFELADAEYFCLDFCNFCGSTVPYLSRNREFYIVPVGSLDWDPALGPTHSIHWAERAKWVDGVIPK